ncbi:hypothetical protein VTJ83DRAFT_3213 [Remersonia thermophila]|uniref:Lethal giant larvae (Lgl)-like C-terminal domain-containing protein n=1 Tax=Remersonia thermophila TaxID=72144 RepID=A0ABR4DFK8_9PEZI
MASFLRARQAGVQNDLSSAITPGMFAAEVLARYGINSQISSLAYDPVQSLLAVGTAASQYGPPKIYVFGAQRVVRTFTPQSSTSSSAAAAAATTSLLASTQPPPAIRHLAFVANRLISVDSRNQLAVWDLQSQVADDTKPAARTTYGRVACVTTDPGLDWVFVGLQQSGGEVFAYDLDRERPAAGFRLPCFWSARPGPGGARPAGLGLGPSLVALKLHPRDIGKMLIAYDKGAVIYSFKQNTVERWFEYVLPAGAPGGDGLSVDKERRPKLVQATWHPTGTFVLTAHEDGSLVFWDPKDGRVVAARTLYRTRVNEAAKPGAAATHAPHAPLAPLGPIKWCCKASNPDDTALLIAGGQAADDPDQGLTFLDLGPTPIYATSSWEILTNHFEAKQRLTLPLPPGAQAADYCLVPRSSPFYDGAQDPIAVLVLLTSGELLTLSFPSGYPITPTNMLHPSLSFVHPFVHKVNVCAMSRERWLSFVETRNKGDPILQGGGPAPRRRAAPGRREQRNIVQVAHADGTVRVWDLGFDDDIENPHQLQVDVARALGRFEDVSVTSLAMAPATGEMAAGTAKGELVVWRWGPNRLYGQAGDEPPPAAEEKKPGGLTGIADRAEPSLKDGLQPLVLYEAPAPGGAAASVVAVSDVGFVAVGFESGALAILDLRGPSVMFQAATAAEFAGKSKEEKRSSFLRGGSSKGPAAKEFPTAIEFGVLTLDGDGYSSIACFVGTNLGHVATLKILPSGAGGYTAQPAGVAKCGGDKVVAICPVNADTGKPALATGLAVAGLREGRQVHGVLVVATQTEARIFKPATAKGASRSFDDQLCDTARVVEVPGSASGATALVAVFGDRTARAYALPSLKELGRVSLPILDAARTTAAVLSPAGDLLAWTGPSELAVLPLWSGANGGRPPASGGLADELINPELTLPPRPTISNLQWMTGTQYISPTDLDLLIGGEDRPPSKRMLAAAAAERRGVQQGQGPGPAGQQEGWGSYLGRQIQERAERLTMVDDAMSKLQETSQGWADEVNKFVKKQKRDAVLGSVKKGLF